MRGVTVRGQQTRNLWQHPLRLDVTRLQVQQVTNHQHSNGAPDEPSPTESPHAVSDTWSSVDDIDDAPCVVRSVGMLLPHTKPGHLVLAQSLIESDDMLDHVDRLRVCCPRTVTPRTVSLLGAGRLTFRD